MTRHHFTEEILLERTGNKGKMLTLFVVLLTWSAVAANPASQYVTPGSAEQEITPSSYELNVDEYLRRYGYLSNDVNELSTDYAERKSDAIMLFQDFAGLKITGEADEATRELMLKPRCAMKDIDVEKPANSGWNRTDITYKYIRFTDDMSESDARNAISGSFAVWAASSKLTFAEKSGDVVMEITFGTKKHDPCPYAFDGPGGVIAHAFYPSKHDFAGDVHFDDDETYRYKTGKGLKLHSTALHESGHALGLSHDETRTSIMTPWYNGLTTLGPTDIKRINALYP